MSINRFMMTRKFKRSACHGTILAFIGRFFQSRDTERHGRSRSVNVVKSVTKNKYYAEVFGMHEARVR